MNELLVSSDKLTSPLAFLHVFSGRIWPADRQFDRNDLINPLKPKLV
jgi:hypothetical protein